MLACLVAVCAAGWPTTGQAAAAPLTFDVLTYNTWGLPSPIGTLLQARYTRLATRLGGHDWVTLQETFSRSSATLRTVVGYPHQAWQSDTGALKIGSGLATLSRYPIVEREYREFGASTDMDRFSRKGVLFTRLQVRPDLLVDVYNTHFQAQDYAEAEDIRRTEDNRVMVEMVKAHDRGYPTFLQGDFNGHPFDPAYQDLMTRLPLHDLWSMIRASR